MENSKTLSKLEMSEIIGGYSATQTEHSHTTTGWHYWLTGDLDVETCGDSYADDCC
jgi:hypothetical protein